MKRGAFKIKCEYILALFPVLVVWKKWNDKLSVKNKKFIREITYELKD
jgi:hypothetical protein